MQHRLVGHRLDHRAADGVGVKLHQQRVLGVPAGDMQRVDDEAARVQRLEDVANAERDPDRGAPVEPAQAVEGGVERQPADDAERMRIGERRAVAVEIGQHMQPPGEVETLLGAQLHDALGDLAVPRRRSARRPRHASG